MKSQTNNISFVSELVGTIISFIASTYTESQTNTIALSHTLWGQLSPFKHQLKTRLQALNISYVSHIVGTFISFKASTYTEPKITLSHMSHTLRGQLSHL